MFDRVLNTSLHLLSKFQKSQGKLYHIKIIVASLQFPQSGLTSDVFVVVLKFFGPIFVTTALDCCTA